MSETITPAVSPSLAPREVTGWRTLGLLTRYHWFVFAVASLSWVLDCMDQQLFNLARKSAVTELLGPAATAADVGEWAGYATSIFLIGWAVGITTGTYMAYSVDFAASFPLPIGDWTFPGYTALYTLILNLFIAVALTPAMNSLGAKQEDKTAAADYYA